ncbi:hypothetical protein [Microbacterium hydrocarbonoxydans]|uniref:hypothetical protein n=1 Tax=Microbacterium hydrocarbonoxydans TaxID=273678 RepID=UPI003D990197
MTDAEDVARRAAQLTTARTETGVFVKMDGRMAVVNIGLSTVTIPCVGFYPPVVGMAVRIDWVNGSPAVSGPVKPLSPLGKITATGNPRATVLVDGESYSLFYRSGYTPAINDQVEINWATGIIQGKVTGVDTPTTPGGGGGGSTPFEVVIRAANSGRYQTSWWSNDPRASNNNNGIWVYENRVPEGVGTTANIAAIDVYLPLLQELGNCSVGVHAHPTIPAGAPAISSLTPLAKGSRSGWVRLPLSFGVYVAAGGRGIGVSAPGGGDNIWRGTALDSYSGALRISGTR